MRASKNDGILNFQFHKTNLALRQQKCQIGNVSHGIDIGSLQDQKNVFLVRSDHINTVLIVYRFNKSYEKNVK